jgi:acetyl esterase/lipase
MRRLLLPADRFPSTTARGQAGRRRGRASCEFSGIVRLPRSFDDKIKKFVPVADDKQMREITKQISPLYFDRSPKTPPTLIIHGDADVLVPVRAGLRAS